VFYEGPPTANNVPHVGHVVSRVLKDLFPRYRTMRGYHVARKAGWDTHGLPVEIEVEKRLGFSGKREIEEYGIAEFNRACLESVRTYEREWRAMTERMGYWTDLAHPYYTFSNEYIESVWWALSELWRRGLLTKGYKIQPYCARCGTTLSSHEVAQNYRETEDPSVWALFPARGPGALKTADGGAWTSPAASPSSPGRPPPGPSSRTSRWWSTRIWSTGWWPTPPVTTRSASSSSATTWSSRYRSRSKRRGAPKRLDLREQPARRPRPRAGISKACATTGLSGSPWRAGGRSARRPGPLLRRSVRRRPASGW
jgi:hypothetical protein